MPAGSMMGQGPTRSQGQGRHSAQGGTNGASPGMEALPPTGRATTAWNGSAEGLARLKGRPAGTTRASPLARCSSGAKIYN